MQQGQLLVCVLIQGSKAINRRPRPSGVLRPQAPGGSTLTCWAEYKTHVQVLGSATVQSL
jgi:hypothetical protein